MRRLALLVALACALLVPVEAQAATGVVEGRVTPLEWAPEVEVCVVEGRPSETCATPAADGSYTLYEVPFGGARIEFVPSVRSGLLKQYWEDASQVEDATTIFLTKDIPRIGGIDAELFAAGSIKGTVTAASGGEALPEIEVCAVSLGTSPSKGCAETEAAGGYEIHGLAPERYSVRFLGIGRSGRYEPAVRAPVMVSVGATTTVDASLLVGSRIEGTVSGAAGDIRLGGVPICLFVPSKGGPDRCTYSEPAGNYSFEGLPAGSYQVGFSLSAAELGSQGSFGEDGFEAQYFDGVGSRAEATVISLLTPGAVASGVDAVLSTPQTTPPPRAPLAASPVVVTPTIAVPAPKSATCRKGLVRKHGKCVKKPKAKKHAKHKKKGKRHKRKGGAAPKKHRSGYLLVLPSSASAAEGSPRWSISSRSFPTMQNAKEPALPMHNVVVRSVGGADSAAPLNVTVNLPTGFTADPSLASEYGLYSRGESNTTFPQAVEASAPPDPSGSGLLLEFSSFDQLGLAERSMIH